MAVIRQSRKNQNQQQQQLEDGQIVQQGGQSVMSRLSNLGNRSRRSASEKDELSRQQDQFTSTGTGGIPGDRNLEGRQQRAAGRETDYNAISNNIQTRGELPQVKNYNSTGVKGLGNSPVRSFRPADAGPDDIIAMSGRTGLDWSDLGNELPDDFETQETAPANATRSPSGTGFTDFQRIVNANRPQALDLVRRVGDTATGDVREGLGTIEEESISQFREAADVPDMDDQLISDILADPEKYVDDPDLYARTQEILGGEFGGPTDISDEQRAALDTLVSEAQGASERLTSPGGARDILAGYDDRYAPGRVAFDELLLGADTTAQGELQRSAESLAPLAEETTGRIDQTIGDIVSGEREQARRERDLFRGGLSEGLEEFESGLQGDLQQRRQAARDALDAELQQIREGNITPEIAARYNVTPGTLERIASDPLFDLTPYFSNAIADVSVEDFASPEDFEYYKAVSQILGRDADFLVNESRADTANFENRGFDKDAAERGARAFELQRRALEAPESGFMIGRDQFGIGDVQQDKEKFQEWKNDYLKRNNLSPNTEFDVAMKNKGNAIRNLENQGYIQIGEIARNNTNGLLFVKPQLVENTSRLYDPELGDYIQEGNIPFPDFNELRGGESGNLNGGTASGGGSAGGGTTSGGSGGNQYQVPNPGYDYSQGIIPPDQLEDVRNNVREYFRRNGVPGGIPGGQNNQPPQQQTPRPQPESNLTDEGQEFRDRIAIEREGRGNPNNRRGPRGRTQPRNQPSQGRSTPVSEIPNISEGALNRVGRTTRNAIENARRNAGNNRNTQIEREPPRYVDSPRQSAPPQRTRTPSPSVPSGGFQLSPDMQEQIRKNLQNFDFGSLF